MFFKILYKNITSCVKYFKNQILEDDKYLNLQKIFIEMRIKHKKKLSKKKDDYNKGININEEEIRFKFGVLNEDLIVNLIEDFCIVYKAILRASKDLDKVFTYPLNLIRSQFNITIENLHKEEFLNTIINCDFIKILIVNIKTIDLPKFIKFREDIEEIEKDMEDTSDDMKALFYLVEKHPQIKKEPLIIESKVKTFEVKDLNDLIIQRAK